VKTPKLIAEALEKESGCGNVKCCCKKSSLNFKSSFLSVSVEAGGVDAEKLSRTTLDKPFHTWGAEWLFVIRPFLEIQKVVHYNCQGFDFQIHI